MGKRRNYRQKRLESHLALDFGMDPKEAKLLIDTYFEMVRDEVIVNKNFVRLENIGMLNLMIVKPRISERYVRGKDESFIPPPRFKIRLKVFHSLRGLLRGYSWEKRMKWKYKKENE